MARIQLWKDKPKGLIDPKLFSEKAENLAKILASEQERSKKKINKRTQFRKFYDEVVRLSGEAEKKA